MRRLIAFLLLLLAVTLVWQWTLSVGDMSSAALPGFARKAKPLPGAQIFDKPTLVAFKIELTPAALKSLRDQPRTYVPATVTIDGAVWTNVAIHVKGAAGSTRSVDDRPALTLSFSKLVSGRRWLGLRKIHLNNSVQDPSFMNEYIGSEMFRAANVPTPRVAFATLEFNQRKLGVYVLKEGFTPDFLKCFFREADGNLYDSGLARDVDKALDLDCGQGVINHADLKALTEAARERDPALRWERLQQKVEVERLITDTAISVMLSDWDGYPLNRNNYRVYFNPSNDRAVILPHGLDQLFQHSDMPINANFVGLVAHGLFDTPPGRKRYEERFPVLFAEVFRFERMTNTIARLADVLRPVQPDIDGRARNLIKKIVARMNYLERQPQLKQALAAPKPVEARSPAAAKSAPPTAKPVEPVAMQFSKWQPQPVGNSRVDQTKVDGKPVLQIVASGDSSASWRSTLRLKPGRYRFEGKVRGTGIQPLGDQKGVGAGLRIARGFPTRTNQLTGDAQWTALAQEFEVTGGERDVTCVCELRARKGQAQFEVASLRLLPLPR